MHILYIYDRTLGGDTCIYYIYDSTLGGDMYILYIYIYIYI